MPPGRERRAKSIETILVWTCVIGLAWGGDAGMRALGQHFEWNDRTYFYAVTGFWLLYATGLITWSWRFAGRDNAKAAQLQWEMGGNMVTLSAGAQAGLSLGMHLAMFSWVAVLAWNSRDAMTAYVVAGGALAMAAWNFLRTYGLSGIEVAKANCQHYQLCVLAILAVINLRLDVWLAADYDVRVPKIHQMLPMWLIPVLTLALVAWIGLMTAAGKRPGQNEKQVQEN